MLLANRVDNFWYGLDVALQQSAFSSVTALVIFPFNFSLLKDTETLSMTVLSGGPAYSFPVRCSTVRDAPDVVANGDILLINFVDDSKLRSPATCRAIEITGHKWRKDNLRDGEKRLCHGVGDDFG